jgi:hypothetical protein
MQADARDLASVDALGLGAHRRDDMREKSAALSAVVLADAGRSVCSDSSSGAQRELSV